MRRWWFAVGTGGVVLRRLPGEAWSSVPQWTAMSSGTTFDLNAVWGTTSHDVFAVGALGTILHWNGVSWRRMHAGIAEKVCVLKVGSLATVRQLCPSKMAAYQRPCHACRRRTSGS